MGIRMDRSVCMRRQETPCLFACWDMANDATPHPTSHTHSTPPPPTHTKKTQAPDRPHRRRRAPCGPPFPHGHRNGGRAFSHRGRKGRWRAAAAGAARVGTVMTEEKKEKRRRSGGGGI
jgi:hypothetical protein